MSYVVRYEGTKKEKLRKGFEDAMFYVNNKKFMMQVLQDIKARWYRCKSLSERKAFIEGVRFMLSFSGIQGVPATAVMRVAIYGRI